MFKVPEPGGAVLCVSLGFPTEVPVGTLVCTYSLLTLQTEYPTEWIGLCHGHRVTAASLRNGAWFGEPGQALLDDIVRMAFGNTKLRQFSRVEYQAGSHHGMSLLTLRVPHNSRLSRPKDAPPCRQ